MREFSIDAFYAFNRRKFSFAPAYDATMLQRRSAGSFMVGAKYIDGKVTFAPEDEFVVLIGGIEQWQTKQLAIGAGYTYNLVLMHKDGTSELKHRNLTLNATLLPMISVVNSMTLTLGDFGLIPQLYDIHGDLKRHSRPSICYDAKLGLALTLNRFVLNITASHDAFRFKSKKDIFPASGGAATGVQNRMWGNFYNWSAELGLKLFL